MGASPRRGPGRPSAGNSAETRQRIVSAARDVFSEFGYGAATFQEIADRAGLTRPAINHYFPSKQALFREVLTQSTRLSLREGTDRGRTASTLVDQVSAVVDTAVQAAGRDAALAGFMVTAMLESRRHHGLVPPELEALPQLRRFLAGAVGEAIARGELVTEADPESLTELLAALMWGVAFYAGYIGDQAQLEDVAAQFRLLLAGRLWQLRN